MENTLTHFALYVDDLSRTEDFYQKVFNWGFESYGTSDFKQVKSSAPNDAPLTGAWQHRKYSPLDSKVSGLEGAIQVKDVHNAEQAVRDAVAMAHEDAGGLKNFGSLIHSRIKIKE